MKVWVVIYVSDTLHCGVDSYAIGVYDNYPDAYMAAKAEYDILVGDSDAKRYTPDCTWHDENSFHAGDGVTESHAWVIQKMEVQKYA